MMNKSIMRVVLISVLVFFAVIGLSDKAVLAASGAKVMQAIVYEDRVKAYIRGVGSGDDATYQISNIATESPLSYQIAEDATNMRTLIMVDNSISIPYESRPAIKEAIKSIIDAHGENEVFRLSTFSEEIDYLSDRYSDDYTVLKNVVDSIEHLDQETYLTDVLYDVVDELNAENYPGYTRIVVFSDGVDNKPIGVTKEELNKKLEETPYPIYTVGFKTGRNDSELENMFAISRLTGCECVMVEKGQSADVAGITSIDNSIIVYEATIPEEAKIGGRQSSKLTMSDGTEVIFSVEMPFSVKQDEPELTPEPLSQVEEVPEPESKPEPEPTGIPMNIKIAVIVAGVLLGIIVVVLIIIFSKKRRKSATVTVVEEPKDDYSKTEIIGAEPKRNIGNTVLISPDGDDGKVKRYRFTLTDAADMARSFRCELINEIKIGRQSDNNIVLSDDIAVHGHHSVVSIINDSFQ